MNASSNPINSLFSSSLFLSMGVRMDEMTFMKKEDDNKGEG
jgi:hypothetical protein